MSFHDASEYCYEWLKNQPFVKEESLTDWLLYDVSKYCSKVFYRAFTRNEEAQNGADWEWWIIVDTKHGARAYRLLVQAKKLRTGGDNYPLVAYGNKNGLQIDLLIEEAKNRNALPLYAYYSCCAPDITEQLKFVKYVPDDLLLWCETCVNGCFLTSAFELHKNIFNCPRRNIREQELVNNSFGLSILDSIFNEDAEPQKFLDGLNRHFLYSVKNEEIHSHGIEYSEKDLPGYVKSLMRKDSNEELSRIENEFRYYLEPLEGILIIDARADKSSGNM